MLEESGSPDSPQNLSSSGKSNPPRSLDLLPDNIFGTSDRTGDGADGGMNQRVGGFGDYFGGAGAAAKKNEEEQTSSSGQQRLDSPSKVLGGSTSWTGGLGHGCAGVFTGSTSVPLSSPGDPNDPGNPASMATSESTVICDSYKLSMMPRSSSAQKLELVKKWTISTYKCSRQSLLEKMGKTTRTVDLELENKILDLRETQRNYANILRLARALTGHFYHVVQTQTALGDAFADMANKTTELMAEFSYNGDTQRKLVKNGEILIGALNFFVSSINTLCHKTIEDTIATIKQYETARIEYDAYKADLDWYDSVGPKTDGNLAKRAETQEAFERRKADFEKLRSDVQIKLKFLDENRVNVMRKQLLLFHNAISAYFSGNADALDATMKQFCISGSSINKIPSWLEKMDINN